MTPNETVEVSLAFVFTCPTCGHENFVRSVLHEFSPDEQKDMAVDLGEKPQTGKWITHPESVSCNNCQQHFRAINPGELVDEKEIER